MGVFKDKNAVVNSEGINSKKYIILQYFGKFVFFYQFIRFNVFIFIHVVFENPEDLYICLYTFFKQFNPNNFIYNASEYPASRIYTFHQNSIQKDIETVLPNRAQ